MKKDSKTLILIRCIEYSDRVAELIRQIKVELPSVDIAAAPDRIMAGRKGGHQGGTADFPVPTVPITDAFVAERGLQLHHSRTGWICGDYVLYAALELSWDYVWLIEPDIYFLNGSLSIISALSQFEHGLITTHYRRAGDGWYWKAPLLNAAPEADVHAMAFGIMRLSRDLVEDSLTFRQQVSRNAIEGALLPNDESIVATTAYTGGYQVIDLRLLYPQLFKFWHTNVKYPVFELRQNEIEPRIVHSGLEREEFLEYTSRAWAALPGASAAKRRNLMTSLRNSSKEVLVDLFEHITKERVQAL